MEESQAYEGSPVESFGKYIRSIRIEKGISLEQVAAATHISIETLMHIEAEDMERLLSPVYIMGFLRSISKFIGADGNTAVSLYRQIVDSTPAQGGSYRPSAHPSIGQSSGQSSKLIHARGTMTREEMGRRPLGKGQMNRIKWIGWVAACLLGVYGFLYYSGIVGFPSGWVFWKSTTGVSPEQTAEPPATAGSIDAGPASGSPPANTVSKIDPQPVPPEVAAPTPLLLDVKVAKETWMKVIADERPPAEYHLKAGDRLALEAAARYNLLIGNATAVQLTLNGKPFPVFGKSGQTVTVQIP